VRLDALDGRTISRETISVYLLPRSAAMFSVKDQKTDTWRDLRPYLGAYVTPEAEAIQVMLKEVVRQRRQANSWLATAARHPI
jgi:hypothetical protein